MAIFGDKKGIPPFAANRLQRWSYILSVFDYEIKFVNSEKNYADCLSRLPQKNSTENILKTSDTKYSYLNLLQESNFTFSFKDIKKETSKDQILSKFFFMSETAGQIFVLTPFSNLIFAEKTR